VETVIDIEQIKSEIVERLLPLKPDKIILFGSYAYGTPTDDSDIDLFLVKDGLDDNSQQEYDIKAHLSMLKLIRKYHVGFDMLSASNTFLQKRKDYFYKVDILEKGEVLYERSIS